MLLWLSLGMLELPGLVGLGVLVKESDQTEKLQHTLFCNCLWVISLGHVCGRDFAFGSLKRRCLHQHDGGRVPGIDGDGLAEDFSGVYRPTSPGLHGFFLQS